MSESVQDQAIALRVRGDLVARPQTYRRRRFWCVKDPVSLAYFHLSDDEYALLRLLDGRATFAKLRDALTARRPGPTVSVESLQTFLAGLSKNGLATTEANGSGERLWGLRRQSRSRSLRRALPSLLAIRFRGIDPSGVLRVLETCFDWAYSRAFLAAAAAFVLAAFVFAMTRLGEFVAGSPEAEAFLTPRNAILLFATVAGVKVLHELAHGLTCRRLGGECHEIGVMLLVFVPCLYCDVSDSWMFAKKSHRIAVAAAGIVVELLLAALATFGWWFSEPGVFNAICMNVMLVCSLNTLWLNGNPLLRYDGYFVLADLLEIPNLAAESRSAVTRLVLGGGGPRPRHEPILVAYGLASALYRVFLTAAIAWMVLSLLKPIGLAPVAYAFGALCAVGLVGGPAGALKAAYGDDRRGRAAAVTLCVVGMVIAAIFVPLPQRVETVAVLQPQGAFRVYAPVAGTLAEAAVEGQSVRAGEVVGRLENRTVEREVGELEGRLAAYEARLKSLESRRLDEPSAAAQLPATRSAIEGVAAQLSARRKDLDALRLVAPAAGTVLPPPERPPVEMSGELPDWSGTPLDLRNRGCQVEAGTLFCLVGDPGRIEAILYASEDDVESLRAGQSVRILANQRAGGTLAGTVEAVATDPLRVAPPELARGELLPVRTDENGVVRPVETTYEVRVRLDDATDAAALRIRGAGRAKVSVGTTTATAALRRSLSRTFRFDR